MRKRLLCFLIRSRSFPSNAYLLTSLLYFYIISSKNGSPVGAHDEGALIATVSKKRRGNAETMLEINVGNGRYINLADSSSMNDLDDSMKDVAENQVKVLQERLAFFMSQLKK